MKIYRLYAVPLFCALAPVFPTTCAQAAPASPANAAAKSGDKYLLPGGAGSKDGSSWANALDAAQGLQVGWDALRPGQTLWVGSGNYPDAKLTIKSGGEVGKLKTLAGKDTGGGAPVFTSDFDRNDAAKTGSVFISPTDGADYWAVQDIHVRNYSYGIATKAGGHQGVRIRNFDVTGCREGISLIGGATSENPALGSHDIEISDCEFTNFTKRGIRLRNGNYDIRINNCVADAGGKVWATEPFHMGFSIEGDLASREANKPDAGEHDITYTSCVALNSYNDAGPKYWDADGFCGEKGVKNVRFVNCMAFDNTDGGWDLKCENVTLENCIAVGNKRNYRFWGKSTQLINCLSADSVFPGGNGDALGLWTNGNIKITRSTFYNVKLKVDDGGKVDIADSILAYDKKYADERQGSQIENVTLANTLVWDEANAQGTNPQFVAPKALWEGNGTAFNNQKFGATKGFSNTNSGSPPFHRTLPLMSSQSTDHVINGKPALGALTSDKAPEGSQKVNMIANGGFEDDLTGWDGAKLPVTELRTEGGAAQGQKYVRIVAPKPVEVKGKIGGLVAGQRYVLRFQSRGNTSPDARIILRQTPSSDYLGIMKASTSPLWTTSTMQFVAPASEIVIELSVRAAGTLDLDDFTVQRAV